MIAAARSGHAIVGAFLAVLSIVSLSAAALPQRGGRGGGGGGTAPPYQATRMESLEADFKLTKDQKKSVKTILDDAHKSAAPIREALARTRAAIATAIQANKAQADVDAAVNSYAEQAAAMTSLEMKSLAQVLQALDQEQRGNANAVRSAFFLMRGIFLDNKKWDEIPDSRSY
jgi:Spy/CpxP family protein refolding chaperone